MRDASVTALMREVVRGRDCVIVTELFREAHVPECRSYSVNGELNCGRGSGPREYGPGS